MEKHEWHHQILINNQPRDNYQRVMPVKKRVTPKKTVSFSDDESLNRARQLNHKKKRIDHDNPPVYVRRTYLTIPFHLLPLLYYFIKISDNYDAVSLLWYSIPPQILYLVFQFNKSTVYGNKILKTNLGLLFVSLGACLLLSVPAMVIIVLFGAFFTELLKETWLLALHCCFLSFPAVYSVFNCDFKVGVFKKYFISIVIGCWISCIVIPLDWDRDWQNWPIPIVIGAYLGAFTGYSLGSFF